MIELHQYPRNFGLPNLSPFCMKVEAWLRVAGLEYKVVKCPDPRKAPMGKLPIIVDDGELVPDSCLIRDHLSQKYNIDLDAHLDAQQRAVSHAFEVMVEERLYWAIVFNRWVDENWIKLKKQAFGHLPPVVRDVVPRMVQSKVKRDLEGHGLGLHEVESVYEFARRDLEALSDFLADKPFFMGDKLSNIDVTLCAFLCGVMAEDLPSRISELVSEFDNLNAYRRRLGSELFPDFFGE